MRPAHKPVATANIQTVTAICNPRMVMRFNKRALIKAPINATDIAVITRPMISFDNA